MEKKKDFSRIALVILAALGVFSCALFVPSVREAVITLGERIVGRGLNHDVWHRRFVIWEIYALVFFIFVIHFLLSVPWIKKLPSESFFMIWITVLVGICFIEVLVVDIKNGYFFYDFLGHKKVCAYVLRGINPLKLVGNPIPLIESIGVIPPQFATTPWGLLLGNLFYPAFLSDFAGKIYFVSIELIALIAVIISLRLRMNEMKAYWHIVLVLFSYALLDSTLWGNCAGCVCCLLFLAILWHKELPIFAGICLAFAMVKPQTAGLVCLVLLLNKKIKPVCIAAIIDALAWIAAACLTRTSPMQLAVDFLSIDHENHGMGIASVFLGLDSLKFVLPLSMATGIGFVIGMHLLLKNKASPLNIFFPACIATTFWGYNNLPDYFILLIPMLLCISCMGAENTFKGKALWFFLFAYLTRAGTKIMRIFSVGMLSVFHVQNIWMEKYMYHFGLIAVSLVMLKKLNGGASHDGARV